MSAQSVEEFGLPADLPGNSSALLDVCTPHLKEPITRPPVAGIPGEPEPGVTLHSSTSTSTPSQNAEHLLQIIKTTQELQNKKVDGLINEFNVLAFTKLEDTDPDKRGWHIPDFGIASCKIVSETIDQTNLSVYIATLAKRWLNAEVDDFKEKASSFQIKNRDAINKFQKQADAITDALQNAPSVDEAQKETLQKDKENLANQIEILKTDNATIVAVTGREADLMPDLMQEKDVGFEQKNNYYQELTKKPATDIPDDSRSTDGEEMTRPEYEERISVIYLNTWASLDKITRAASDVLASATDFINTVSSWLTSAWDALAKCVTRSNDAISQGNASCFSSQSILSSISNPIPSAPPWAGLSSSACLSTAVTTGLIL